MDRIFYLRGLFRNVETPRADLSRQVVRFAHGEPYDNPKLTGWRRTFNSETIRGRANFAKLYWCIYITAFIIYKINKKISAKKEASVDDVSFKRKNLKKA